jgi:hypothetical protein
MSFSAERVWFKDDPSFSRLDYTLFTSILDNLVYWAILSFLKEHRCLSDLKTYFGKSISQQVQVCMTLGQTDKCFCNSYSVLRSVSPQLEGQ